MCNDINKLASIVRRWAASKGEIRAVLLFGSRVKGTGYPDSDWDVCVVVDGAAGSSWYGTWIQKADHWKIEFCYETDLGETDVQFCVPTSETVRKGLEEGCRVLFLRDFSLVPVINPSDE